MMMRRPFGMGVADAAGSDEVTVPADALGVAVAEVEGEAELDPLLCSTKVVTLSPPHAPNTSGSSASRSTMPLFSKATVAEQRSAFPGQ